MVIEVRMFRNRGLMQEDDYKKMSALTRRLYLL